jgi:hypothetical protein
MEQWRVVVEKIAVLHETAAPTPDDMEVLRFIAVEAISKNIGAFERQHQREQDDRRQDFSRTGHSEVNHRAVNQSRAAIP